MDQNSDDIIREKKTRSTLIHKFRAIHIVEGDLQFIAIFFYAHKMIRYAEQHGLITDEQYGGRKNRMAQSVVLNKFCYYNISHQLQMSCAFMDDDARACYDCIVTCPSRLECRKWDISNNVANFINKFIEGQKYHVRSAYGISKDSYSFREDSPTQGSGQGLSWAGPRWTNTGTTICNIMEQKNTGMTFIDPTGEINVHKTVDLFVDDTATGVTSNNIRDGKTALDYLQQDEQKHAYLLCSSGHLLALYKYIFYYYHFKLKGTKFVHTTQEECPGKLHLRPKFGGHVQEIGRLDPDDAHETLGCFISISNNQTKQFELMKKIIKEWVRKIQSSPLSKSDKVTAYKDYLEAKMLYVLPVRSFTCKQCTELDKLLSLLLLNIHGVQRNANRNIIYMSEEFGGLWIYSVYHLQGIAELQFFQTLS